MDSALMSVCVANQLTQICKAKVCHSNASALWHVARDRRHSAGRDVGSLHIVGFDTRIFSAPSQINRYDLYASTSLAEELPAHTQSTHPRIRQLTKMTKKDWLLNLLVLEHWRLVVIKLTRGFRCCAVPLPRIRCSSSFSLCRAAAERADGEGRN